MRQGHFEPGSIVLSGDHSKNRITLDPQQRVDDKPEYLRAAVLPGEQLEEQSRVLQPLSSFLSLIREEKKKTEHFNAQSELVRNLIACAVSNASGLCQ